MDDKNILNIPVAIAGRTYPVLATAEEVDDIKLINEKLNKEFMELHQRYASKLNKQDILAMLLLTYAKDLHEERTKNDLQPISERVQSIESVLEKALQK